MSARSWIFAMVLLMLSIQSAALAQDAPSNEAREQAAERFERGVQLFREQAFRAALVEFQRAYELAPDYRLLYNLARAKHQLQDYLGATKDYEAYLSEGGGEIAPERRAQVEETLNSLRQRVGRIEIKVNRAGAEVFVDDLKVGTAPLPQLLATNVGRHRVSARTQDGAVAAEFVDVAGGDIAEVTLTLAAAELAQNPFERGNEAPEPWSTHRKVALASWVAGGALLASSVASGVMSLRATEDFDEEVDRLGSNADSVEERRTKADRLSLTTDVLIGLGAAAVVTGTALWLFGPKHAEQRSDAGGRASLGLDVGPSNVTLSGRF